MNNNIWFLLAGLFAVPFVIPMILPDPYATIAVIGIMIGSLFFIRTRIKGVAQNMLQTKMVWACSACGMQSNKGECPRCGSRHRKLL